MSTTKTRAALLTSLVLLVTLSLALAAPAWAADESAVAKVAALEQVIGDEKATWDAKWKAYREAKDAIDAAKGAEKDAAQAAYDAIQGRVAVAIRRDELPLTGWLMGIFGALLLWGGLVFCIRIARRAGAASAAG